MIQTQTSTVTTSAELILSSSQLIVSSTSAVSTVTNAVSTVTEPQVKPSKNAANLYAEMAASILEDEDLKGIAPPPMARMIKTQEVQSQPLMIPAAIQAIGVAIQNFQSQLLFQPSQSQHLKIKQAPQQHTPMAIIKSKSSDCASHFAAEANGSTTAATATYTASDTDSRTCCIAPTTTSNAICVGFKSARSNIFGSSTTASSDTTTAVSHTNGFGSTNSTTAICWHQNNNNSTTAYDVTSTTTTGNTNLSNGWWAKNDNDYSSRAVGFRNGLNSDFLVTGYLMTATCKVSRCYF